MFQVMASSPAPSPAQVAAGIAMPATRLANTVATNSDILSRAIAGLLQYVQLGNVKEEYLSGSFRLTVNAGTGNLLLAACTKSKCYTA